MITTRTTMTGSIYLGKEEENIVKAGVTEVSGIEEENPSLKLSTRRWIWYNVQRFPGIHFRDLERKTSTALGALDYHLHVLEKAGLIRSERVGSKVRFFPTSFPQEDQKILGLLRQEVPRRILLSLLEKPTLGNQDLARVLKKSESTVSFHLNKLGDSGAITRVAESDGIHYRVVGKERLLYLLITYYSSFLDKLVDRFVASMKGLRLTFNPSEAKVLPKEVSNEIYLDNSAINRTGKVETDWIY
jgi:DNA-binding transcriptional ArsR family regulator